MNQLGKNLVLTLCVVATLLIILGLRRNFGGGASSLLSQPSGEFEPAPTTAKNSPRPRVLQAMPVTQHDQEVLSPTGPQYLGSEFAPSRASDFPISPIPSASPGSSPRSLDAPTLVPVATQLTSPVTDGVELPKATPAAPSATRPSLPEIVLTEADDSFWTISERVYGTGVYYRALFRHNEAKVLRPDQLRPGVEVSTPPLEVLRERYPADFPAEPATTK